MTSTGLIFPAGAAIESPSGPQGAQSVYALIGCARSYQRATQRRIKSTTASTRASNLPPPSQSPEPSRAVGERVVAGRWVLCPSGAAPRVRGNRPATTRSTTARTTQYPRHIKSTRELEGTTRRQPAPPARTTQKPTATSNQERTTPCRYTLRARRIARQPLPSHATWHATNRSSTACAAP